MTKSVSWLSAAVATLLCTSAIVYASPNATPVAASSTPTFTPGPGCPSTISIVNGGFESGTLDPWDPDNSSGVNSTIVSPGYKSGHALKVNVPAGTDLWDLLQITSANACYGFYYNISYSWNWDKYPGPKGENGGHNNCAFYIEGGYIESGPYHYATEPGWHSHWYIGRDLLSHCESLQTEYVPSITCQGKHPAFTLLLDGFSLENAKKSPYHPPPPDFC